MPKMIQVIQSSITRGAGTKEDACRTVILYYDVEGNFLAEYDGWAEKRKEEKEVEAVAEGTPEGTVDGTTECKKKREYYVTVCRGDSEYKNLSTPHPMSFNLLMKAWKFENEQESS